METYCDNCGLPFSNLQSNGAIHCPACLFEVFLDDEEPGAPGASLSKAELSVDELVRLFPELEVIGEIGMGGMGRVFLAKQKALDRKVALKILRFEAESDLVAKERFEREARALAEISHPNIVEIFNFGERDGHQFLLMEYIDGSSLSELLRQGPLELELALAMITQICDGVGHAHQLGILHRDIKPGNILISKDGTVKVADFGLAKSLSSRWGYSLTENDVGFGTPVYMAPEQLTSAREVDESADIFSLAVLFYEMLTGKFPGEDCKKGRGTLVKLKKLDKVIRSGLNPDPESRPKRVSDFKDAIPVLRGVRPPRQSHRRNPAFAFAVLLILTVGTYFLLSQKGTVNLKAFYSNADVLAAQEGARKIEEKYLISIPEVPLPAGALLHWTPADGDTTRRLAPGVSNICELDNSAFYVSTTYGYLTDGSIFRQFPPKGAVNSRAVTYNFFLTADNELGRMPGVKKRYVFKSGPAPAKVRLLSGGSNYSVVLTGEGKVRVAAIEEMWHTHGEMFDRIEAYEDVVDLANWSTTGILLKSNGKIVCWNTHMKKFITEIPDHKKWTDVDCGLMHFVGIDSKGAVQTWPVFFHEEDPFVLAALKKPDFGSKKAIRIDAGHNFNVVQFSDGTWRGWGNDYGDGLIEKIASIGPARDICFQASTRSNLALFWIGTPP
ncbi:MAG: serine/threonine-protein kinase [Verrucomicrobiales bacterium]|nr:serine/threonine-protein kinase [Verrucomicrobiales bacterium]